MRPQTVKFTSSTGLPLPRPHRLSGPILCGQRYGQSGMPTRPTSRLLAVVGTWPRAHSSAGAHSALASIRACSNGYRTRGSGDLQRHWAFALIMLGWLCRPSRGAQLSLKKPSTVLLRRWENCCSQTGCMTGIKNGWKASKYLPSAKPPCCDAGRKTLGTRQRTRSAQASPFARHVFCDWHSRTEALIPAADVEDDRAVARIRFLFGPAATARSSRKKGNFNRTVHDSEPPRRDAA